MADDAVTMDKLVSLCKRRGFVFGSSEIYGGLSGSYDYGHYGVLLKNNVKAMWWRSLLQERDDVVALDSAIIQHPRTWEASGHLAGFTDPLIDCRTCKLRFRADHLEQSACGRKPSKRPGETPDCDLTEARDFNLMFETTVGPVKEEGSTVYLRPETAQGIFLNFKHYLQFSRKRPPFGIAQIGKSFRNEITARNFIFRMREFEQMEMEYFVPPDEADSWFEHWTEQRVDWYTRFGVRPDHLRLRPHDAEELSHYSSATSDIEYLFPGGWSELEGIANRGDFDLSAHAAASGQKLEYVDTASGARYVPHVIEPAAGADRAVLAFLADAYDEDEIEGESRTVLRLHPQLAPVKAAILPLVRKDGQPELAREVFLDLRERMQTRVRRGRSDRPPLPPSGRDRHAVGDHDRPPDARGPHGDRPQPRRPHAGADGDRRSRRGARAAAAGAVAEPEAARLRPSRPNATRGGPSARAIRPDAVGRRTAQCSRAVAVALNPSAVGVPLTDSTVIRGSENTVTVARPPKGRSGATTSLPSVAATVASTEAVTPRTVAVPRSVRPSVPLATGCTLSRIGSEARRSASVTRAEPVSSSPRLCRAASRSVSRPALTVVAEASRLPTSPA